MYCIIRFANNRWRANVWSVVFSPYINLSFEYEFSNRRCSQRRSISNLLICRFLIYCSVSVRFYTIFRFVFFFWFFFSFQNLNTMNNFKIKKEQFEKMTLTYLRRMWLRIFRKEKQCLIRKLREKNFKVWILIALFGWNS